MEETYMNTILTYLKASILSEIFADDESFLKIAEISSVQSYRAGEVVLYNGSPTKEAWMLLLSGEVLLTLSEKEFFKQAKGFLGVGETLSKVPSLFTITALSHLEVLSIRFDVLDEEMDVKVRLGLMKQMVKDVVLMDMTTKTMLTLRAHRIP